MSFFSSPPSVIFPFTFPAHSVERNALSINSEIGLNIAAISMISFSFGEIEMCMNKWSGSLSNTGCIEHTKYNEWKVLDRSYVHIIVKATAAELQR